MAGVDILLLVSDYTLPKFHFLFAKMLSVVATAWDFFALFNLENTFNISFKFKTKEDLKLVNIEANRNNIDFVLRYFFELNQILKGSNLVLNKILIEEFDLMILEDNSGLRFRMNKSKIENQLENLKTFLKSQYFNNIKDTFSYLDLRYQNKGAIGFRD